MDFFSHQDRARRNTWWLVIYFAITVVTIIVAVYFAAAGILYFATRDSEVPFEILAWNPQLWITVVPAVMIVIAGGSLYKTMQLAGDGHRVAVELGGVKIQPNTRSIDERVLLNVVEEMALASGTPVPSVYLLPNEEGINAFAAGTTPQNAVIGVTRGCVETMSRDELQGVIAHEFSHILNGDMRLNLRLIGLLYGILLLAMLGFVLIRMLMYMPTRSSNKDDGKGALAIIAAMFTLGVALIGIGYVGVFFASLIQSAVSRQREFLADASAVQFTRNPQGIAGALKRIGGWKQKSQLKSVYAREASHMFFGQGVMSLWFATHPPLNVRIKRIDPSFDGTMPPTSVRQHKESEIVDPQTLQKQRKEFLSAHVAALAGVDHFESQPDDAVTHIGHPDEEHIEHAHQLVEGIPSQIVDEVHDPLGAVTVVYALLMSPESSPSRDQQWKQIDRFASPAMTAQVKRLVGKTDALEPEQKLPLACMALPALQQLSDPQLGTFRTTVAQLIAADERWTIFEYALHRFIERRIVRSQPTASGPKPNPMQIVSSFADVLATLAHLGGNTQAESAYHAGWQSWKNGPSELPMLDKDACTLKRLDRSLDVLHWASNAWKRAMINAFSECIAYDRRSTINEIELLRVISDALGCPMPPVLANAPIAAN